ncbi:hypothetical protein ACS15_4272 [Ralstonia insidiosa]|uniref:Uncharacterized protein n=1 Tax=Ralstonia insidiosa TaxID=190721 RepID=A0AAC9BMY4_9RALS|nr:hypothetical protein ACS15_4272 [Ralstonia insidiosa]
MLESHDVLAWKVVPLLYWQTVQCRQPVSKIRKSISRYHHPLNDRGDFVFRQRVVFPLRTPY